MKDEKVRVAYATNMDLIGPTALSLSSAIQSTQSLHHVDILGVSLTNDAANLFRLIAERAEISIKLHSMDDELFHSARHKGRHVPKAALARLFLPQLVEGRVLYIDGDTLIRRDLASLYGTRLDGNLVGAVRDFGCLRGIERVSRGKTWPHEEATKAIVAPHSAESYVNSGVLLMDCASIRDESDLADEMVNFDRATEYRTVDQDFFNALFKGRIKHLNPAWNSSWGRASLQRSWIAKMGHCGAETKRENDGIYHYHGPLKPWHSLPAERWKRSISAVACYKAALWAFQRRYPNVAFN